ncbi:deoxyuridine 5`-triphosphate nucleotidohydrolase [Firmicutes bacterium CAG:822]|nr:deoxyuridine 5`-triphosphate nucleotidohydrolase [Firmicutes bacterium CAG:822]
MRKFEKISLGQFIKDTNLTEKEYNKIILPHRATGNSAGYDFHLFEDLILKPGEIKKVPTAIKASMNHDEVLMLYIRSSLGFKYNLRLCNQTGIIDSDYYNNENNEGHIFIAIQNEGKETVNLKAGDRFAQGIFMKYLTVDDETQINNVRQGGMGSTN